jgi:hypothetical protein
MQMTDALLNRWIERGGKFFRTVGRNAIVRATLRVRGLDDDELARGWALYSELLGFGPTATISSAQDTTAAAAALNELDAWDAPAYAAVHAVLDARYPKVSAFLFHDLQAATGPAAAVGVERFLDRVDALREGKADNVNAKEGRAAVALLGVRKILDDERTTHLRALLDTVRKGAQPHEAITREEDPRRAEVARQYVAWLHEWREVARSAIGRRDYRVALGLAQNKRSAEVALEPDDDDEDGGDIEQPPAKVTST